MELTLDLLTRWQIQKITQNAPTIQLDAQDAISASSERDMNLTLLESWRLVLVMFT